jgi:hypothetical protein
MLLFQKRWLRAVGDLGKLTGSIQYLSGFEPETPWIVV